MENFEFEASDDMMINYSEVTKSKDLLAVTRLLAADLLARPYMSVGDYMKSISDSDLAQLIEISEDDENPRYEDLILISEMLAAAEGLPGNFDLDAVQKRIAALISFLVIESLARKGLVDVYRENFSFGEDMGNKIVVKKKDV